MLLVKTKIGQSRIHGIGLFAAEPIPRGTIIWRFDERVDLRLAARDIDELSPACQEQIRKYTYKEKHTGMYVLCGDDARFFNHLQGPNCIDVFNGKDEDLTIAATDIAEGEELTCDYAMFDQDLLDGKYTI
jgi:SET domain-containing protein